MFGVRIEGMSRTSEIIPPQIVNQDDNNIGASLRRTGLRHDRDGGEHGQHDRAAAELVRHGIYILPNLESRE